MSWDYFVLFAIAALVCWAIGALQPGKERNRAGFTDLLCWDWLFSSALWIGMWISLERPRCGRWGNPFMVFFLPSVGRIDYLCALEVQMDS